MNAPYREAAPGAAAAAPSVSEPIALVLDASPGEVAFWERIYNTVDSLPDATVEMCERHAFAALMARRRVFGRGAR